MNDIATVEVGELRRLADVMVESGNRVLKALAGFPPEHSMAMVSIRGQRGGALAAQLHGVAELGAAFHGLKLEELQVKTRTEKLARARMTCFWLARNLTPATQAQVGEFWERDHGTILSGLRNVENQRAIDEKFRAASDALLEQGRTVLAVLDI